MTFSDNSSVEVAISSYLVDSDDADDDFEDEDDEFYDETSGDDDEDDDDENDDEEEEPWQVTIPLKSGLGLTSGYPLPRLTAICQLSFAGGHLAGFASPAAEPFALAPVPAGCPRDYPWGSERRPWVYANRHHCTAPD